jgi:hypothetical protein
MSYTIEDSPMDMAATHAADGLPRCAFSVDDMPGFSIRLGEIE